MKVNVNVIKAGTGLCGTNAYSLTLEHRLEGLIQVYQEWCAVALSRYNLGTQLAEYISRGGHIHFVTDEADQVVGWAGILIHPSNQLLENVYPVERVIISDALTPENKRLVARVLIESIIADADATLPERFDDAWILVTVPAISLGAMQALFTELECAGFSSTHKAGLTTCILWRKRSAILAGPKTT